MEPPYPYTGFAADREKLRGSVQSADLRASSGCRRCDRHIIRGGKMPNRKYLLLQRSETGAAKPQQPSPAEMQEMYAAFNAWKEKFKDNILDMGGQLRSGGKVLTPSGATDGPFVETKEIVGGYMLVSPRTRRRRSAASCAMKPSGWPHCWPSTPWARS